MYFMPCTPLIACSSGNGDRGFHRLGVRSNVAAADNDLRRRQGRAIVRSEAWEMEIAPARMMNSAQTVAKKPAAG